MTDSPIQRVDDFVRQFHREAPRVESDNDFKFRLKKTTTAFLHSLKSEMETGRRKLSKNPSGFDVTDAAIRNVVVDEMIALVEKRMGEV